MGYWAGSLAGSKVPVFTGISDPSTDELKCWGRHLLLPEPWRSSMWSVVTPEAPTCEAAFGGRKPEQVLDFEASQLADAKRSLNKQDGQAVSVVCIGCPHTSIAEIGEIALGLKGKKVKSHVELWVLTALPMRALAERCGYSKIIEAAGGRFVIDTCPILSRWPNWRRRSSIRRWRQIRRSWPTTLPVNGRCRLTMAVCRRA